MPNFVTIMRRGIFVGGTRGDTARLYHKESGLAVIAAILDTADGPVLQLGGENCNLEGDEPGRYLLTPLA